MLTCQHRYFLDIGHWILDIVNGSMQQLSKTIERILTGDIRSISRALSDVESQQGPVTTELLKKLYPHTGSSTIIGVTGSPGAGKSTLVEQLAHVYSDQNLKVGICGEHGGEPSSVEFCHGVGMNYVSCSPYRVPIARLAAAQASAKVIGVES